MRDIQKSEQFTSQMSLESTQTACSFYQKNGFQIHAQDIPNPKMVAMVKLLS